MRLTSIRSFQILAIIAAWASVSCVPKRVQWSPDGQQAAILTEQKAWFTTADGKLLESPAVRFEQLAWFPDSRRFVGVSAKPLVTWAEVKEHLTAEQAAAIVKLAPEFRRQILEHSGSFQDWQPKLSRSITGTELIALWTYTREQDAQALRDKLGGEWEKYQKLNVPLRVLQMGELEQGKVQVGRVLTTTLDAFGADSLRVSPDSTKLAYVLENAYPARHAEDSQIVGPSDAGGALMLLELADKAEPRTVASFAAWQSDFTSDSRSLVYATTKPIPENDTVVLGSIERKSLESSGDLEHTDPAHLAGVIYFPNAKITCLADGRILFSNVSITLPMATADMSGAPSLFSLDPERRATIAPMLTKSAESKGLTAGFEHGLFDVRPDAGAVTLLGSEGGQVAYYVFATGQVEFVVEKKENWELLDQPTWRDNQELSLVVPAGHEWGSPNRPEVVLYSIVTKQPRCISRNWPDELVKVFQRKEAKTEPAETQASQ